MKVSVVTLLLCAAVFCAQLQESGAIFKKQKCGKIVSSKFTNFFGRALYCSYLCRSFPPRMEREFDGTPCWTLRGKGTCQDGRCSRKPKKSITTFQPLTPRPKSRE